MAIDLSLNIQTTALGVRTNTTVTEPTSTANGDFLLGVWRSNQVDVAVTIPSGWTLIAESVDGLVRVGRTSIAYIRRGGSAPDLTWVHSSCDSMASVWRLTGVIASGDPNDATASAVDDDTNTFTWTAITTGTNNSAVIGIMARRDATSLASGTTYTERLDTPGMMFQADIQASAGSTGSVVATESAQNDTRLFLIALKEALAGPTINTQPSSTTKNVGETATFNISATTSGGTLHYQWKVNGSNVGTDSNSYTTGTLTNSDQWAAITCVVTDDNGSTTSGTAVLTIAFAAAGTGPRRRNIMAGHPIGSLGWLGIVSSGSVSAAAYSAGAATDIAVGSSTVQANALSSAVSTALAIGAATTRADAFTQGAATDIAVGVSRISGDAYTQGTSTAQAVGSSSANTEADAYTAGIATDIATGESVVAADAFTQGTSTAQAEGATSATVVEAAGYSAGASTAEAVGSGGASGNTVITLGANPWRAKGIQNQIDQENEEILQLLAQLVPHLSRGGNHHASR